MAERVSPLEMTPDEFRRAGHDLVDRIAELLATIRGPADHPWRDSGRDPCAPRAPPRFPDRHRPHGVSSPTPSRSSSSTRSSTVIPRFMGYITSSAAPIGDAGRLPGRRGKSQRRWLGALADRVGDRGRRRCAGSLSWWDIPSDCGGLLVSGGNMANLVCFLAGRRAMLGEAVAERRDWPATARRGSGLRLRRKPIPGSRRPADLFGLGTDAIRWIPTDADHRMRVDALRECHPDRPAPPVTARSWWWEPRAR